MLTNVVMFLGLVRTLPVVFSLDLDCNDKEMAIAKFELSRSLHFTAIRKHVVCSTICISGCKQHSFIKACVTCNGTNVRDSGSRISRKDAETGQSGNHASRKDSDSVHSSSHASRKDTETEKSGSQAPRKDAERGPTGTSTSRKDAEIGNSDRHPSWKDAERGQSGAHASRKDAEKGNGGNQASQKDAERGQSSTSTSRKDPERGQNGTNASRKDAEKRNRGSNASRKDAETGQSLSHASWKDVGTGRSGIHALRTNTNPGRTGNHASQRDTDFGKGGSHAFRSDTVAGRQHTERKDAHLRRTGSNAGSSDIREKKKRKGCSQYKNKMKLQKGRRIIGYNDKEILHITLEDCERSCLKLKEFFCKSFDFWNVFKTCILSKRAYQDVPKANRERGKSNLWTHGKRICKVR